MPANESVPVKATLIVEVDGHVLRFEHPGRAWGVRCYGEDPARLEVPKGGSLEDQICVTADALITEVSRRAEQTLSRMYPVADEPDGVNPA